MLTLTPKKIYLKKQNAYSLTIMKKHEQNYENNNTNTQEDALQNNIIKKQKKHTSKSFILTMKFQSKLL